MQESKKHINGLNVLGVMGNIVREIADDDTPLSTLSTEGSGDLDTSGNYVELVGHLKLIACCAQLEIVFR